VPGAQLAQLLLLLLLLVVLAQRDLHHRPHQLLPQVQQRGLQQLAWQQHGLDASPAGSHEGLQSHHLSCHR
jgi:hypothetical protein